MTSPVLTINGDQTVQKAAEIMHTNNFGSLLVKDGDNQIGIITERDVLGAAALKKLDLKLKDIAAKPVITVDENSLLGDAAQLMITKNIRRLMVTNNNGKIVGVITIRDLTEAVHDSFLAIFDI